MATFAIDVDNNITALAGADQAPQGTQTFHSPVQLDKISQEWPAGRLVEIWNSFAGVAPFDDLKLVKKFTDRKTAVARIWAAIQRLAAPVAPQAADVPPAKTKAIPRPSRKAEAPTAREGSKKAQVLELLRAKEGATLEAIMEATGWQAHSVRGFLSGAISKKMGLSVESFKTPEGARAYRIS